MKHVISSERLPIKMWLDDVEENALEQAKNLANLPFAFKHVALMPDCHMGYGMPIGGVLATKDVIIPNAVGVDIGCGVCAVKTGLTEIGQEDLKKLMVRIRQAIPLGFKKHKSWSKELELATPTIPGNMHDSSVVELEEKNAVLSIGTLGGGNHFIEIQNDKDGFIWIMLHSGSRNLGYKVAKHYNDKAIEWNDKYYSSVSKEMELAFLPMESWLGQNYIKEMSYCVDFALANRKFMMERICGTFINTFGAIRFDEVINIAHNYASRENHFGKNVWVHRKGATLARKGTIGVIPGSQGTKSYIVKGLGNQDSFMSCSHGAGRVMGRKQAQRELNLIEQVTALDNQGIIHSIRGVKDLDEAPGAYKDISEVIESQKDLVETLVELTPLAVIKG